MMPDVFEIMELLEHILLHLPLRDLLQVQRVSLHFRAVIHASSPIQQVLFFKPLEAPFRCWEGECHQSKRRDGHAPSISVNKVPMNPFLADHLLYTGIKSHNAAVTHRSPPLDRAVDLSQTDLIASWRKMLVMQPTSKPVSILGDLVLTTEVTLERGLTMSELLRMGNREGYIRLGAIPPRSTHFPWFEMRATRWDWWFSPEGLGHGRDMSNAESRLDEITGWNVLARTSVSKYGA